jgi:hypothetical protein
MLPSLLHKREQRSRGFGRNWGRGKIAHIARGDHITPPGKGGGCNTGIFQVRHLQPLGSSRDIERKRNQGELRTEMREHRACALLTEDLIDDVIQGRVATRGERPLIGGASRDTADRVSTSPGSAASGKRHQ